MVEHKTAGLEQSVDLGEVYRQIGPPDVFAHANRRHLVVGLAFVNVSVVLQEHLYAALQTFALDDLVDIGVLVLAEGNASGVHAVVFCGPQQQAAPASTNVDKALTGLQPEFFADVVELELHCLLGQG
ncbi:hypothetical protein AFERRI_600007 [Acidithiobacillus ferrivorans]|uniref:Uncharacterized protein n=1 Tax=Acidithiobacillus ferrivorans TaxID=160808 RepID=A0A060UTW4_9PROT|nr:hypothetical protein AFERRI_600007 [Acidithiobacillus ferrivorans]